MSIKSTTASITAIVFLLSMIPDLGRASEPKTTGKHRAMEYIQAGKSIGATRNVASSQQSPKKHKVKAKKKSHSAHKQKLKKAKDQKSKIAKSKSKKKQNSKKSNSKRNRSRG